TAEKLRIDFEAVSGEVKHRGSRGRIREAELVESFLSPHLPDRLSIAHNAEIVDSTGETSNECDIVIYDSDGMSFIGKTDYRVIPIESVYIVIEVKSRLSKKELRDSVGKIKKIKEMTKDAYVYSDLIPIMRSYAAFASDAGSDVMAALIQSQPQRRRRRGGSA